MTRPCSAAPLPKPSRCSNPPAPTTAPTDSYLAQLQGQAITAEAQVAALQARVLEDAGDFMRLALLVGLVQGGAQAD